MSNSSTSSSKKPRSYKDMRKEALRNIVKSSDISAFATINMLAAIAFVVGIEELFKTVRNLLRSIHFQPVKELHFYGMSSGTIVLIIRIVLYYLLLTVVSNMVRRYFINMMQDSPSVSKFLSSHMKRMFIPNLMISIKLLLYKSLLISPLAFAAHEIVHYYRNGVTGSIDLLGLMMFMLGIGFTLVWTATIAHYFVSLALVKYIIELNPRANFFDACDLSVKLMEGRHRQVLEFMIGLFPVVLLTFLLFPLAIVFPYISECRTIFAKEIMGDHWQDKIPAMAMRWEKQQARKQEG